MSVASIIDPSTGLIRPIYLPAVVPPTPPTPAVNAFQVSTITIQNPYSGQVLLPGQYTRVICNTPSGVDGEVVLEEQTTAQESQVIGVIPDPSNGGGIQISYSTGVSSTTTISTTTADNGKLVLFLRVSPTSVIRLN